MPESVRPSGPADAAAVKISNLMLVWHCLQQHAPLGRVEIAQRTGLSKGALTALAGQLIDLGLIRPIGAARSLGRGRRIELLAMDGASKAVVAVQVRLEDLAVQATDLGGQMRCREVVRHGRPMGDPGAIARQIAAAIDRCRTLLAAEGCRVERAAIVMAAPLWGRPPVVPAAVDFGWGEVDLLALVRQQLNEAVPLRLENDAAAAIRAEREELSYRPSTLLYLKSNTGIGGAAIVNDQVLFGAHGMACEPGHLVVDPGGARCGCGQRGCLVTVAGPEVVLARAGLAALAFGLGSRVALGELVDRWRAGEEAAGSAVDELSHWITAAVTALRMMFDPELIVLGGYWSALTESIAATAAREWAELGGIFAQRWRTDLIRPALLGEAAALRGAIMADTDRAVRDLIGGATPAAPAA